jgi:DNA-binding NarL/FixJ family response regulator
MALEHPVSDPVAQTRPRLTLVHGAASRQDAVRVALAGSSSLVRAAFRALLEAERDVAVAGEAGSDDEAIEMTRRARPDVVLLCLDRPELGSIDVIRRIVADPEVRGVQVVVLIASDDAGAASAAMRAGARGFLPLDTDPAELVRAVRVVARGEAFLSPGATQILISELVSEPGVIVSAPEQLDELTNREREVMALAAGGLNNGEIAERLTVSPATAKTHVSRAMMKLHAGDRAQLVAVAYRTGLVQPRRT